MCIIKLYNIDTPEAVVLINVCYGVLGSAIVSGILALSEYFVNRQILFENIYQETLRLIKDIRNIPVLHLDIDKDIVINYYLGKMNEKTFGFNEDNSYISELKTELSKNGFDISERDYIKDLDKKLLKLTEYYVTLSKLDDVQLGNYCSQVECIKKLNKKQELLSKIYIPIHKELACIREFAYHGNLYLSGESKNRAVILEKLLNLQDTLLKKESKNSAIIYYSQFVYKIDVELEHLRAFTYNIKEKVVERFTPLIIQNNTAKE